MTEEPKKPTLSPVPGDALQLNEPVLLQNIGRYVSLFEHEQRKRLVLVQAYYELKAELDALKAPKYGPEDVVQGNP